MNASELKKGLAARILEIPDDEIDLLEHLEILVNSEIEGAERAENYEETDEHVAYLKRAVEEADAHPEFLISGEEVTEYLETGRAVWNDPKFEVVNDLLFKIKRINRLIEMHRQSEPEDHPSISSWKGMKGQLTGELFELLELFELDFKVEVKSDWEEVLTPVQEQRLVFMSSQFDDEANWVSHEAVVKESEQWLKSK